MWLSFVCVRMALIVWDNCLFLSESDRRRSSFFVGVGGLAGVSLNRPVTLQPESALSHLLTLSAHCHSNGVRESRSLGKAKYPRRNTSLTSLCFNSHQGYSRNVHCALVWMYTYFTNPIKTQFASAEIHYSPVCVFLCVCLSGKEQDEYRH